ncbi:MAG TPA: YceI family protein [Pyrinomonadaceae bacterium]|nr:YceI family protein [Pyrinomonadaceae bacterium]
MVKRIVLLVLLMAVTAIAQDGATTRPYPIDNNHSTVGFSVPILGGLSQVKGKFTDFAITINNDEKDITKSSVSVVIKATSVDTGIEGRDRHLRNADFFDVEKFPEITFKSERIEKKGKQFIAHGPLTMHGVTKPIALPFSVTGTFKNPTTNKLSVGYSAKMVLNRRDFGINYSRQDNPTFVGDNITVEIELVTRALDAK